MTPDREPGPERAPGGHWSQALERAAACLAGAERLLITSHRKPDGDAVGSMVALASLLRGQGKIAVLYNPDQLPRRYKWLPLARGFRRKLGNQASYQATVVVDCAENRLLDERFPPPEITGQIIVLDHHSSAASFGDIYVCDPEASSVGLLVARLARMLEWPIDRDAAMGIYYSLACDTGSFRFANTTAEAMRVAADMIDAGVDPWQINERLHESFSAARYRLLGALFERMELALGGRIAIFRMSRELLHEIGATWEDSADLVNYARTLAGVECGVLFSTMRNGATRVSLRSKGHVIDAGAVCLGMGGGGHRGAAGCMLSCDQAEARDRILAELSAIFASHESLAQDQPSAPEDHRAEPDLEEGAHEL